MELNLRLLYWQEGSLPLSHLVTYLYSSCGFHAGAPTSKKLSLAPPSHLTLLLPSITVLPLN